MRDHEVQLVFTPTTRPSGTPAVAWLPPTESQTPKPTVQKPLMGLELHVAIVKICYPAEFPIFALKFFKPIFLRENTLTFEIKSNELEAGH